MPVYEYRCVDCGECFDCVERMSEHTDEQQRRCPKCGGANVEQQFTPFYAKTSKKS